MFFLFGSYAGFICARRHRYRHRPRCNSPVVCADNQIDKLVHTIQEVRLSHNARNGFSMGMCQRYVSSPAVCFRPPQYFGAPQNREIEISLFFWELFAKTSILEVPRTNQNRKR